MSTSTDSTSVKDNNQKAKTNWLTDNINFLEHKLQFVKILQELQDTNTENIKNDNNLVNQLYDKVFNSLDLEYKKYQNEEKEKNKSWWQSVKDAFNRGKAEGKGGIKGFFKGCWEATKTGWQKAPTWAKVGVGAGLIAGSALCMPISTYTVVPGGHSIFTGTSFSLKTIPLLLSHPSSWILPQSILPLTMICGGANIAGRELGMAGKEYVDKIRTKLNMTDKEKKWHDTVLDKKSEVIEKKRAFLLFLISTLNKPLQQRRLSYDDAGECFDAIKKAEDKAREKNNNINLSKKEIGQSQSQTIEQSDDKIKLNENNIVEKESKNDVNNPLTNNEINNAYNEKIKEMKNDSKISKEKINAYNQEKQEEKNNILKN